MYTILSSRLKTLYKSAKVLYMVDCCNGSFYYTQHQNAIKKFYNDPRAHTLAKYNGEQWLVLSEKFGTEPYKLN